MITYQEEDPESFLLSAVPMLEVHHAESNMLEGVPFDPDYEAYKRAYDAGFLLCVTCRDNEDIVGFVVFLITPNLYSKKHVIAVEDMYYVKPEYRKGFIAIKILKFAENLLALRGVTTISIGCKAHSDQTRLYERLGYRYTEKHFSKLV